MSPKTLKIALAVSVALNVFALAAGATLLIGRDKVEAQVQDQRRPGRENSAMALIQQVSPDSRASVRQSLRDNALAAKPDFEQARDLRRQAIAAAKADPFDGAQVTALLAQSRDAELRGRARLEAGAVGVLETLSPQDRAVVADILARRRGGGERGQKDKAARAAPSA